MPVVMSRATAVLALLAPLAGCTDWREHVTGGLAVREPTQDAITTTERLPFDFGGVAATLTPRAHYRTRAWVVAVDRDFSDDAAPVLALDLGLAWGPVASRDLLRSLSFHLATRYLSVRWSEALPLDSTTVLQHISNHHLVVTDPALRGYLDHVEVGDLVTLEGRLVDVTLDGTSGRLVKSSLRREDVGSGACEVLWVEKAAIERPWLGPG